MRLVGLPVHLWHFKVPEKLGDACEGYLDINKVTQDMVDFQGAQILVQVEDWKLPQALEVKVGEDSLDIQLWCEYPQPSSEQSFLEIQRARVVEEAEEKGEEDEDISRCKMRGR